MFPEASKPLAIPSLLSLLPYYGLRYELSAHPSSLHAHLLPCSDDDGLLSLWNLPQLAFAMMFDHINRKLTTQIGSLSESSVH